MRVLWLTPAGKAKMADSETVDAFHAEREARSERAFNDAFDRYADSLWEA